MLYGAVKAVLGMPERSLMDYGSFNFHGPVSRMLAKASSALTLALVGLVLAASWRGARARRAARGGPDDQAARTSAILTAALSS